MRTAALGVAGTSHGTRAATEGEDSDWSACAAAKVNFESSSMPALFLFKGDGLWIFCALCQDDGECKAAETRVDGTREFNSPFAKLMSSTGA